MIVGKPASGPWFSEFAEPYHTLLGGRDGCGREPNGGPAPVDPRGYPPYDEITEARDALELRNATLLPLGFGHEGLDDEFVPSGTGRCSILRLGCHHPSRPI